MQTQELRHTGTQLDIAQHFDEVAKEYDYWKKKNWLYYDTLRSIARAHSDKTGALLDVGCGTGEMMRAVESRFALGIDISPEMIAIARSRNVNRAEFKFEVADITQFKTSQKFDTILFFDVIEHVVDMQSALRALHDAVAPGGEVVISMANPLWEPILLLGERLGMKMPEGPHFRMSARELIAKAGQAGLTLKSREWHLLFPKYIPGVSWILNQIGKAPFIRRLCVIEVFVFGA